MLLHVANVGADVLLYSHRDDLVARLIADTDNQDLWETKLLGNQFAKDMAATGPSDKDGPAVLAGFRAYMVVSNFMRGQLGVVDSPVSTLHL